MRIEFSCHYLLGKSNHLKIPSNTFLSISVSHNFFYCSVTVKWSIYKYSSRQASYFTIIQIIHMAAFCSSHVDASDSDIEGMMCLIYSFVSCNCRLMKQCKGLFKAHLLKHLNAISSVDWQLLLFMVLSNPNTLQMKIKRMRIHC